MIFKVKSEEVIFFMVSFGIINCHCEECFACAQRRLREESQTDCFTEFTLSLTKCSQ